MMTTCPKKAKQSDLERWHKNHEEYLNALKKTRDHVFKEAVAKLIGETYPHVKLTGITAEKLRTLGEQAHFLSLNTNGELKSTGENPHIQSNWGQFQESPTVVLSIAQACKIILMAERIERGLITHKHYGEQYLSRHSKIEKSIGAMSFVHLGLSAGYTAQSLYTLYQTIDKTDLRSINIFNAAIDAASHAGDFAGDVFEKLDILCSLPSVIKRFGAHTRFGAIASVLAPVSAGLSVFTQARSWFDPNISTAVKIIGSLETGIGATGKVAGVVATAVWLDRARRAADALKQGNAALHASLTATKASVVGALAASIVAAVFTPLQVYSIHEEFNYAKQLDNLAEEFSKHGYNGHVLLAELYRNKATLDSVTTALQTTLTLVGGGASLAMMASGIGAPFALAIGAITTTLSILIDSVNQGVLENIANQQRTKILNWERKNPGKNYFSNALDAHYATLQPQLIDTLQDVQSTWNVDQVVAVIQTKANIQTHELAALTRLTEKSLSGKAYIDVFKDGAFSKNKNVSLDTEKGIINLTDNHIKQALVFVQPLLTPGIEARKRKSLGKNEFITELNLLSQHGWVIRDLGTADTKADFSGVVQRLKAKDDSIKEITIKAEMGNGDDVVIATTGDMVIDGGTGKNAVDYSTLPKDFSLTISALAGTHHYSVKKQAKQAKILEEAILEKQINYGKNKEKVQYRDALITVSSFTSTDTLKHIQTIKASNGSDSIDLDASDNVVYGLDGDDNIKTYAGKDIVFAGKGNDTIDSGEDDDLILQNIDQENDDIDGGAGTDTVCYATNERNDNPHHKSTSKISQVGILVDLKAGIALKCITRNHQLVHQIKDEKFAHLDSDHRSKRDVLKNIENIDATELNDVIFGDDKNNTIRAGAGNDVVNARAGDDVIDAGDGDDTVYAGSGNDLIIGGRGHDEIFAGAGDDNIVQTVHEEKDKIDGGDGFDIVDYSLIESAQAHRVGEALTKSDGIVANLQGHSVIKYMSTANGQAIYAQDTLNNVEGIVATMQDDTLRGDHQDNLLDGAGGDDLIQGRQGNDRLKGGQGNDTYEFSSGDGQDTIEEDGGKDKVKLLSITNANQVTVHKEQNNLVIRFTNEGVENSDTITVLGHFSSEKKAIEEIVLGNNVSYDVSALIQAAAGPSATQTPNSWSFNLNALTPLPPTLFTPIS